MSKDNESFDLAHEWVADQLAAREYVLDGPLEYAVQAVKGMHQCDCIPIWVTDRIDRRWRLFEVTTGTVHITATYEPRPKVTL